MSKLVINQKVKNFLKGISSWVILIAIVVVMRYTGMLAGVSFFAQSALMETGLMNVAPENNLADKAFNYNFTIKDLSGNEVNMSDFKGKVIFLNLWATWCGPCRAEMPSIQELYKKVDHDKIAFIILSLDTDENQHKISRYIQDQAFSFPVYRPQSAMPNQLRVSTIPTTFVVGPDGRIKMKKSGAANYATEDFQKFLEEQLAIAPVEESKK